MKRNSVNSNKERKGTGLEGSRRNLKQRAERIEGLRRDPRKERKEDEGSEESRGKSRGKSIIFKRRYWETRGNNEATMSFRITEDLLFIRSVSFAATVLFRTASSSILLHSPRHYCTRVTRVLGKRVFPERNINYERFGAVAL